MNTSSRSRNGGRKLNRSLNQNLNHGLNRYATTLVDGACRPRQPDYLRLACRALTQYLRLAKRMERQYPHIFGPQAHRYFLDTLQLEKDRAETEAALRKVYGPPAPGDPVPVSTLWTDRSFPSPRQRRLFLKHFHEHYPSP
jgi:hypothetical protein